MSIDINNVLNHFDRMPIVEMFGSRNDEQCGADWHFLKLRTRM